MDSMERQTDAANKAGVDECTAPEADALQPRLAREKRTVEAMVRMYCRDFHRGEQSLCEECEGLLRYASVRLARCRFQEEKPACGKCPVHCYRPSMRRMVKDVMRHSGPRMTWRHPVYALLHFLDKLRGVPEIPPARKPETR